MKIACVGGGPAGLYLSILMKRQDPDVDFVVYEQNRADDTFGFGVVFSDATLSNLESADPTSFADIQSKFAHWDAIDTHVHGKMHRSGGHGFCGLERRELLCLLQRHAAQLGVVMHFQTKVEDLEALLRDSDLVVAADGAFSDIRSRYAESFEPSVDWRPNRFVWLGTTFPFEAFTFIFKESAEGLFRVHAYRYADKGSTFIVECTDETLKRTGLEEGDEEQTIAYLESLFVDELQGHRLTKNRSIWRRFPTVKNKSWSHKNLVLVGDAAHTAHFSIGSGTKLAMEDCISLADALLSQSDISTALRVYETKRRPTVAKIQSAAQTSLEWFENTERYMEMDALSFTYSLLTRSLRVTHENLRLRDPRFIESVNQSHFAGAAPALSSATFGTVVLDNRITVHVPAVESKPDGSIGDVHAYVLGHVAHSSASLIYLASVQVSEEGGAGPAAAPGLWNDSHSAALASSVNYLAKHTSSKSGLSLALNLARGLAAGDVEVFGDAAKRCVDLGLSALQIEMANSDALMKALLHSSKKSWEEKTENPLKVLERVRRDFQGALSVRFPVGPHESESWSFDDGLRFAQALKKLGVDWVAPVRAWWAQGKEGEGGRLFQASLAEEIRQKADIPVCTEGGIDTMDDINSLIAAKRADLVRVDALLHFDPGVIREAARVQRRPLSTGGALSFLANYEARGRR